MPRYVVVTSSDKWLEIGEYDNPQEAAEGGVLALEEQEDPNTIYVYEVVGETRFELAGRKVKEIK